MNCLFFLSLNGILFVCPSFSQATAAAEENQFNKSQITEYSLTQKYLEKAEELNLHEDNFWHILLHYRKSVGKNKYKSEIETPEFFLSPQGKTDPKKEMEECIKNFCEGKSIDRFPARFKWLDEKLNFKEEISLEETEYSSIKSKVNPTAVYMVFPSGYMQNPASMFGHTFLLFENESKPHLMGQSISFGARNTDRPGFIYAMKGLFGLYYGDYYVEPYTKQILKYSSMDMRDIWEYKLKLSEYQIDMLFRHTLELSSVYSKYYYIGKNCSYSMMTLLESAFPDENLVKKTGAVAEPTETVKILYEKGLTEEPVYRPSLNTQINASRKALSSKNNSLAKKYCLGKIDLEQLLNGKSDDEKKLVLALCSDYLKYLLSNSKITQEEYRNRYLPCLSSLSKIKGKNNAEISSTDFPHRSHDSHKIAFGGGFYDDAFYGKISFRFVNHDLMDSDVGLNPNTQLSFFSASLLLYPDFEKPENTELKLGEFDFLNIMSLPVSDSFFLNRSVDVKASLEYNEFSLDEELLSIRLKFFAGLSCRLGMLGQFYSLLGSDFYFNPYYEYFADVLPGVEAGLLSGAGIWKQHVAAVVEQGIFDLSHLRINLLLEERFCLSQNTMVSCGAKFNSDFGESAFGFDLGMHINF